MVDSLPITSAATPAPTPAATRGAAQPSDDGPGNFAQVLHDARDAQDGLAISVSETKAGAANNPPANAPPPTQAMMRPGVTLQTEVPEPGPAGSLKHDGLAKGMGATANEAAAAAKGATSSVAPAADVVPAHAPAQGEAGADSHAVASTHAESKPSTALGVTTGPAVGHAGNAEPAKIATENPQQEPAKTAREGPKPEQAKTAMENADQGPIMTASGAATPEAVQSQQKNQNPNGTAAESLFPPGQIPSGTNGVTIPAPPLPVSSAAPATGRTSRPHGPAAVGRSRPGSQMAPTGSADETSAVSADPVQASTPLPDQQTGELSQITAAPSSLQQSAPAAPPANAVMPPARESSITTAATVKSSQSARAVKETASSNASTAPDDPLAAAASAPIGKPVDGAVIPAPSAPPFAAALSRHVAAEAVSAAAAPAYPAQAHPSQNPVSIVSDAQASGTLLPPASETATRSPALEVGFHDTNLGWLSVRATTDAAGGLHAAVGAKTPAALAAVDTMLPALGRFLQQENVAVHSVSTAGGAGNLAAGLATASGTSASSAGTGSPAHQQGTGRDPSQRNRDRNSVDDSTSTGRAATRLAAVSTTLRYSQVERLSTVSVRI